MERCPKSMCMSKAGLVALIFLVCCVGGPRERSNLAGRMIRSGDQLFSERMDPTAIRRAIDEYEAGVSKYPAEPRPLGRLARAYTLFEYGHAAIGEGGYATARQYGLQCLMMEPAFGGLVSAAGGQVTKRAVATLDRGRIGCMTWTAIAWSRWLDQRKVIGASIDLEAVQALAKRAVDVFPDYDDGRPYAALGLALAIPPAPLNPDLAAARVAFGQAVMRAPGRLTPSVDLAEFVSGPEGKEAEWRAILSRVAAANPSGPDALENSAAIQRAEALLEAGLDARWNE